MFTSLMRAEGRGPTDDFWFEPVGRRTAAGMRVNSEQAMRLSAVYSCVRVLTESFAVLPTMVYRPRVDGRGRDIVRDHWLHYLFNVKPNAWQTPYAWREMLQGHLVLRGNAFCEIFEGRAGSIAQLVPRHPDRVTLELTGDDAAFRYKVMRRDGSSYHLRRDQMWHLRGLSDDGYVGLNPIEQQREAIGASLAMQEFAGRFFANDSRPTAGWIENPGKFADKAAKDSFREKVQEAQSAANRGKMMVLELGMKYHQVGVNNKDAQFLEARQFSVTDIARIFRVPPHKIAELSRSTNNNIEHQSIEFWRDTMLPWCVRWASSIKCDLLGEHEGLDVNFDFEQLLHGDLKSLSMYFHNLVLDGILTRNEARDALNYNPLDGLDEPLVPQNERELSEDPTDAPDPDTEDDDSEGKGKAARPARVQTSARKQTDRMLALATAAAERVARKEWADVCNAYRSDGQVGRDRAYARHATFVAAALGVRLTAAVAYCESQAHLLADQHPGEEDFLLVAEARLRRLAATGEFEEEVTHV